MRYPAFLAVLAALVASATGCATKEYVQEQIAPVSSRVDALEGQVSGTTSRLGELEGMQRHQAERIAKNEADIQALSQSAREALERATAAGKLAEGKLLYEVVLTDDQLRFRDGDAKLSASAKAHLDGFAAEFRKKDGSAYLEIQGHTDSRGSEAYNLKLGERRAKAVRDYLHDKGKLPLHRMSFISYGEARPVANNMYKPGREQNRRVVLVVLK